jgi:hypothetical protein
VGYSACAGCGTSCRRSFLPSGAPPNRHPHRTPVGDELAASGTSRQRFGQRNVEPVTAYVRPAGGWPRGSHRSRSSPFALGSSLLAISYQQPDISLQPLVTSCENAEPRSGAICSSRGRKPAVRNPPGVPTLFLFVITPSRLPSRFLACHHERSEGSALLSQTRMTRNYCGTLSPLSTPIPTAAHRFTNEILRHAPASSLPHSVPLA